MAINRDFILFIALSLLSTILIGCVYPQFVIEKNSITLLSPDHLRAQYDAAIGNLGSPNQAGTITGSLVYPKQASNSKGCKSFDGDNTFTSPSSRPAILLLHRGDCYFSLKVWNGQKAGAAAVLVADDVYEPLKSVESSNGSGTTAKNKEKITGFNRLRPLLSRPQTSSHQYSGAHVGPTPVNGWMSAAVTTAAADDLFPKITIPSAFISRSLGENLKKALQNGEEIVIKLDWTGSAPNTQV